MKRRFGEMTRTIGEFSIDGTNVNDLGQAIAMALLDDIEEGKIKVTDDMFQEFLCCIFAEGNLDYLRVIAQNYYTDTRKDVVLEFIDIVEEMVKYGKESLDKKSQTFISL